MRASQIRSREDVAKWLSKHQPDFQHSFTRDGVEHHYIDYAASDK